MLKPVIIGAFSPPALACIRSWGRRGLLPGLICIQADDAPKPDSKYLTDSICLSRDTLFSEQGRAAVRKFLAEFNASGITCIDESIAAWINDHLDILLEGTACWVPDGETLARVLDKGIQIEIARQVGLEILPTHYFSGRQEGGDSIPASHFPLCLRPSVPGSTEPAFKVRTVADGLELRRFWDTLTIRQAVIGQPFVDLPNLVVHGARTLDGANIGMQGFLVERKFEGVTLVMRPHEVDPKLLGKCIAFANALDVVGPYHFEFLYDPVTCRALFLELNNRMGGTTAKVMACGYDEPTYALASYGVASIPAGRPRNVHVSNKQALIKYIVCALKNRLTSLDHPNESKLVRIFRAMGAFLTCRDDVFCLEDLSGTMSLLWNNLKGRCKRLAV